MQRVRRKNPRLQEKLESLQREIARVEHDIKGISHAIESPDPDRAIRRLRKVVGEIPPVEVAARPVPSEPAPAGGGEKNVPPAAMQGANEPLNIPRPVPDQRFQTYFGTGSLHSVRPLRQERQVQRNKAIIMLILAAMLVYGVINLMF
ncbi:MAG: hypothetical protein WCS52_15815 [bacterium]|jgi:hypothetical protein